MSETAEDTNLKFTFYLTS